MPNNDPQYDYCVKCGKVSFLCTCEDGEAECDCALTGACDGCDSDSTVTLVCDSCKKAIIDDDDAHSCEECAVPVCTSCATPVVDEHGEMYVICMKCL
jgi:hypothetical protein